MKTNLKDNIWIVGFNQHREIDDDYLTEIFIASNDDNIIYEGDVSDITEEIAKLCALADVRDEGTEREITIGYKTYGDVSNIKWFPLLTAKESIRSACSLKQCVIYKIS